ncbi:hypothetical protein RHGRI_005391 [Rhododendron griersonianum]|uniref:Uncharacterized protein n=1 Tax=Rhododendron griersonianum TaxID=479676 RepID=A0AAV6LC47_9ERIC|nr:hypothetical protein RHGRI_005391 [Rhododendron griersonianum]KAG5562648.1 hypothetical protein RHGRI_005391 [Rhododendron griersonianum]
MLDIPDSQMGNKVLLIGRSPNSPPKAREVGENSTGIMEEIEKCKDNALERKKTLEEQKENFQKAAFSVFYMLNNKDIG